MMLTKLELEEFKRLVKRVRDCSYTLGIVDSLMATQGLKITVDDDGTIVESWKKCIADLGQADNELLAFFERVNEPR